MLLHAAPGPLETRKTRKTRLDKVNPMEQDPIGRTGREALGLTRDRCTATNRAGERCGRPPIRGGFVCALHGGRAPQVRRSARERLLAMVDPAIDALLRALKSGPACEVCGRSDADRDPVTVKAAQLVLDRVGMGPQAKLLLQRPPEIPAYASWLSDDELQQVSEMIARAKDRMVSGAEQEDLMLPNTNAVDVEDAVLVEADDVEQG